MAKEARTIDDKLTIDKDKQSFGNKILIGGLCILLNILATCSFGASEIPKSQIVNLPQTNKKYVTELSLNTVQDGTLAVNNYHNQLPMHTISASQDTIPPDTIDYEGGRWIYNYDSLVYMPDTTMFPQVKK